MSDNLSDSPVLIMQKYLVGESLFTLPSSQSTWPLHMSSMPDGINVDDNVGCVFDHMPQLDGRYLQDGELFLHYSFLLRIRCANYEIGWTKAMNILQNIMSAARESVLVGDNNYEIQSFTTHSGITSRGTEENTKRRSIFELSFIAVINEE